jgi:tetratricopeptide (TPR) repeat protein
VLQRDREQNQVAQQSLDASLTHFYKAVAVGGGNQRLALAMASANMIRAELSRRAGQYDAAVGHARRAVDCVVAQASSRALDVQTTKVRAHAKLYLASVLRPLGRYEEERLAYDEALVDIEKLCATLPDVPDYLTYRAQTQLDYALLLHLMRDCPSAKKMLEAALPWLERVANASSNPQEVFELAIGRDALGEVLRDLGDAEAARQLHALAGQSLARLATDFPMVPEYRFRRALNRSYFGQSVAAARADAEAHEAWAGAERLLDDLIREASAAGATSAGDLARYHQARGFVRMYRGYLSWSRDNADGAQRAFGEALADLRSATKVGAAAVEYVHDLAWFQVKCPLDSLRAADDAVRAAEQASSTVPANVNFLGTLGAAQIRAKNFADGAATLRRVIEARPPGDPRDWLFLAVAQTKLNKRDEARQSWKTGLDRMQALCPASVELRAIEKEFAPLFGEGR